MTLLVTLYFLLTSLHSSLAFSPLIASVTQPNCNEVLHTDVEQAVREKLQRIASGYEKHIDTTMKLMDMEIELSEKTERCLLRGRVGGGRVLSDRVRMKQQSMRECLAANNVAVQRLLLGWKDADANQQLFQRVECARSDKECDDVLSLGSGGVTDAQMKETEGYDTAIQVITHTARDWTMNSSPCRDATNGWILRAIVDNCAGMVQNQLRVLVPGSGLSRLAYDISTCHDILKSGVDICVEANDSSVTMAFAAKSVLDLVQKDAVSKIHPFASDPHRNEIHAEKRFEMQVFPDEEALTAYRDYNAMKQSNPDLTFTVGDFSSYSHESRNGMYNVVATSFFIDTATNIYEYIFIMKHLLCKDTSSVWVNCGPVQWHPCAMLRPTVDELKGILEACGFDLIIWEVAEETVAYRHPDDFAPTDDARFTREEGYRPLRFVARLRDYDSAEDLRERIEYVEYLNNVATGKDGE